MPGALIVLFAAGVVAWLRRTELILSGVIERIDGVESDVDAFLGDWDLDELDDDPLVDGWDEAA